MSKQERDRRLYILQLELQDAFHFSGGGPWFAEVEKELMEEMESIKNASISEKCHLCNGTGIVAEVGGEKCHLQGDVPCGYCGAGLPCPNCEEEE